MLYQEKNSLQAQINTFLSILISQGGRGWGGQGAESRQEVRGQHRAKVAVLNVHSRLHPGSTQTMQQGTHFLLQRTFCLEVTNHSATQRECISSYKGQPLEVKQSLKENMYQIFS